VFASMHPTSWNVARNLNIYRLTEYVDSGGHESAGRQKAR
jgi:hypothetical protein